MFLYVLLISLLFCISKEYLILDEEALLGFIILSLFSYVYVQHSDTIYKGLSSIIENIIAYCETTQEKALSELSEFTPLLSPLSDRIHWLTVFLKDLKKDKRMINSVRNRNIKASINNDVLDILLPLHTKYINKHMILVNFISQKAYSATERPSANTNLLLLIKPILFSKI